jgi:hypothetical protein
MLDYLSQGRLKEIKASIPHTLTLISEAFFDDEHTLLFGRERFYGNFAASKFNESLPSDIVIFIAKPLT